MSNNSNSKNITFLQLLSENSIKCDHCGNLEWTPLTKIEIPIIQRDYAQGREGKEELRNNFLSALLKAVNGESLELDFIYGSVKDDVFQPLDGQQRLTTLFLLHWYVAIKEDKLDDDLKKLLTKFTYETRTSSREFCIDLVDKGIDFDNLLETDYHDKEKTKPKNNELSKTIIDSSWFFLSWKRDPTIKSMLTMLDDIHNKFENEAEIWNGLNNISFHFIELQNFGLSDDLYIKMNARGKPLTDFENFKAKFEQYINNKNWEGNVKPKPTENFAHKIDTVWTDLFWKHKGEGYSAIDYEIINFIAGMAIFSYALKENEKKVQELSNSPIKIRVEDFDDIKAFNSLCETLDLYANKEHNDVFEFKNIPLWNLTGSSSSFNTFIKDANKGTDKAYSGPSYPQRVFFYAQTQYLLKTSEIKEDDENFLDWIRFVRNIIENTTIDSPKTFVSAINAISAMTELSKFKDNILTHLNNGECDEIPFFGTQIVEEKIKAQLILKKEVGADWKKQIIEAENLGIFRGKIKLLLEEEEKCDLDTFKGRKEIIQDLFKDGKSIICEKQNLLGRALLAKGLELNERGTLWLGGYENQYWRNHVKDSHYIPSIINVVDELRKLKKGGQSLQVGLKTIICNHKVCVVWKKNLIENGNLFERYSKYGKVERNWRGVNLYQQQNFNKKTNAILIGNSRNQIISGLIKNHGYKLEIIEGVGSIDNLFFSGDIITIKKESKNLVFDKEKVDYNGEHVCFNYITEVREIDENQKVINEILNLINNDQTLS